jgi:tripartite-type tricarboxylate transporter receptor subunit TctC
MQLHRRRFLQAAALAVLPDIVFAESYPSKPLRWVVGFPPGGGADIVSRIMAQALSDRLGQPVIVENRPGASSNISVQAVVNAPPDGYTLLFIAASAAVNVSLFENLPFNLLRDIAPVAGLIDFPLVMVANSSFPPTTVAELIAYAKAHPGQVNIGSFGTGSTSHVAGELFKNMAGIDMVHVPYRGGAPMLADLLSGHIQIEIDVMTGVLPQIRSGNVRALAVLGAKRFPGLPDVPTVGETLPLYVANSWCGVGVPKATPPDIIERLNREINASLNDPVVKTRLADVATTPIVATPEQFGSYMTGEVEKWGKVVRAAGIRVE